MAQSSCSIYVQSSCFPKLVVNRVSFINALPDKSVIFSSRKANFMCFATSAKEEGADTSTSKRGRLRGAKMIGCGSAIPRRVLTNDDLSTFLETSHEWISSRTGICERRVLSDGETMTSLATEASRKALEMANVDPQNVDAIWLCTSTPDDLFGSAAQLQAALGCSNCFAFDLTAACSGFVVGLVTAAQFLKAGAKKNILVVGADALSRHVDWTDRGTCILFGDAAGAMLLQACDEEEDGLLGFDIRSDGNGLRHLNASSTDGGDGRTEGDRAVEVPHRASYKCIEMNGKEVFRFAVRAVPQVLEGALDVANLKVEDMDWLLLHQANQRILDAVAERLKVPRKKVISNLAKYGNTSAASIPLALDEAVRSGKINGGDLIAAAGFGAGLTWASAIFKWGA